jgi:hypothetical protein
MNSLSERRMCTAHQSRQAAILRPVDRRRLQVMGWLLPHFRARGGGKVGLGTNHHSRQESGRQCDRQELPVERTQTMVFPWPT